MWRNLRIVRPAENATAPVAKALRVAETCRDLPVMPAATIRRGRPRLAALEWRITDDPVKESLKPIPASRRQRGQTDVT